MAGRGVCTPPRSAPKQQSGSLASYYCNPDRGVVDSWKLKGCFDTVYSPTLCLFFSFFFFYRLLFTMHHLTVFVVCVTGIMLCMAGTSYSNTCNCHCSHTCNYGNSPDDSVKSPYGSKANPGFSCKDINANRRKQNAIYWIRLTGIIQKK